jgi:hypothetical protein
MKIEVGRKYNTLVDIRNMYTILVGRPHRKISCEICKHSLYGKEIQM